jgi:hypothetical protein
MRWRELYEQGKLDAKHLLVRWMIYFNLTIGLMLDALLNIVSSIIMLELPRYDIKEWLLTARLSRWLHIMDNGWYTKNIRMKFVKLGQQLLDVVDTDGIHIK